MISIYLSSLLPELLLLKPTSLSLLLQFLHLLYTVRLPPRCHKDKRNSNSTAFHRILPIAFLCMKKMSLPPSKLFLLLPKAFSFGFSSIFLSVTFSFPLVFIQTEGRPWAISSKTEK